MVHRHASLPLEYLGWALEAHDVRQGLPQGRLGDRYGGIVTWFTDDELPEPERYQGFMLRQLEAGMHFAILGNLGFAPSGKLLDRLGLAITVRDESWKPPYSIARRESPAGFETVPRPAASWVPAWKTKTGRVALEVKSRQGGTATPVIVAPWGAMALDPFVMESGYEGRARWMVDPFAFFRAAFGPPPAPVLDLSTENGRRVLTVHIDGDGIANLAEMPGGLFSAQVIQKQILELFRVPTTVSVIESDVSPQGLNPEIALKLEEIARAIFRLPHVEIASHTYSHPFNWMKAVGRPLPKDPEDTGKTEDPDYLPIPGYKFSVAREVDGSVDYINQRLAPPGKKVRAFLWSGDALPDEDGVARAYALGLANLNGDNAVEPKGKPLLSMIPSSGRWVGKHYQCYSPAQNENVFTNEWTGPFNGYRHAIDLFRFSESPRRLNAIAIYYHFYSGSKLAALDALKEVYRWTLAQDVLPLALSAYTERVLDFQRAQVSRGPDGAFIFDGVGSIRTLRLEPSQGWPDLARSRGVVGVRDLPQGRYVALDGSSQVVLTLRPRPPEGPYLSASNGRVVSWKRTEKDGRLAVVASLAAHAPLEMTVAGCPEGAQIVGSAVEARTRPADTGESSWIFKTIASGEVTIVCR
jgi:hypothetical protein